MFELTAHHHVDDNTKLGGIRGYAVFDTETDRDAELARYPKFIRLRASRLTAKFDGSNYTTKPTIEFSARFYPEVGNAANETGAKRARRFLALAEYTYAKPYKNSISTLDAALALLPN